MNVKFQLLLLMALLALGGHTQASPLPEKPHIYVEGAAEVQVVPDQMMITVGLEETAKELAAAKKVVDQRSRALLEAMAKLGVAKEDITTSALHISPAYEWREGQQIPLGSRVYRQVDITLRDLTRYSDLIAAIVDAPISNTVSTQLQVADDRALADKALIAALADARQRAEQMARGMDKKLGQVYSVSEFDLRRDERQQLFSPRALAQKQAGAQDMAFRNEASEPFEPGLITAKAQVYVVYLLK